MAAALTRRAELLGISERELAHQAGLSRGAVHRALSGEHVRGATLGVIESTIERLEHEVGMDLASQHETLSIVTLPDGTIIRFQGSPDGVAAAAEAFLSRMARNDLES